MGTTQQHYAGNGAHTDSYYAATANRRTLRASLQGDHSFDICIVGAGFSGLSAGLHLAEKGYNVAIVEGARIGWGASGRNGGQIVNGLNASLQTIDKRYGRDTAKFVAGLVMEGGDIIRERVARYDISCDLKANNVFLAYTQAHMRELQARHTLWRDYGVTSQEMLSKSELSAHIGSDVYSGGMIDYQGGHLHPLNLSLGEADAFESLGGRIFERSRVVDVDDQGASVVVRTLEGAIHCKKILLCGNAYLGHVVPALTWRVMPVSTQIMATEPLTDEQATRLLPGDECFEDIRYILDYFRMSADRRLLFGGGTVYGGSDPKNIEIKLRKNMNRVFPELANKKIDYAWSGNFALSFSRVPQLGRLNDNTYFAHGYSGHGVTGSHTFGRILSEAIDGDMSRFDVFAKVPWIPFPGGRLFRVPYSVVGSWYYAFKDKFGL